MVDRQPEESRERVEVVFARRSSDWCGDWGGQAPLDCSRAMTDAIAFVAAADPARLCVAAVHEVGHTQGLAHVSTPDLMHADALDLVSEPVFLDRDQHCDPHCCGKPAQNAFQILRRRLGPR